MARSFDQRCCTPSLMCRVPVFPPRRMNGRSDETVRVETSWGRATISGTLTQRHHDLLDAVVTLAAASRDTSEGDVVALIDTAVLLRALGPRWNIRSVNWALQDLLDTRIDLVEKTTDVQHLSAAHLIVRYEVSGKAAPKRTGSRGAPPPVTERSDDRWTLRPGRSLTTVLQAGYVEITISREWLKILREMPTWYPQSVWRLRHGESQALARFMLSHRDPVPYYLETVLKAIDVPRRHWSKARKRLQEDVLALAGIGVFIGGGRVWVPWSKNAASAQSHASDKWEQPTDLRGDPLNLRGGGPVLWDP